MDHTEVVRNIKGNNGLYQRFNTLLRSNCALISEQQGICRSERLTGEGSDMQTQEFPPDHRVGRSLQKAGIWLHMVTEMETVNG